MSESKGVGATFTDDAGRAWAVHEFVSYDDAGTPGAMPRVVRRAVIFESDEERRLADEAPLDWRTRPQVLRELFSRAGPLTERYTAFSLRASRRRGPDDERPEDARG